MPQEFQGLAAAAIIMIGMVVATVLNSRKAAMGFIIVASLLLWGASGYPGLH